MAEPPKHTSGSDYVYRLVPCRDIHGRKVPKVCELGLRCRRLPLDAPECKSSTHARAWPEHTTLPRCAEAEAGQPGASIQSGREVLRCGLQTGILHDIRYLVDSLRHAVPTSRLAQRRRCGASDASGP